MDYFDDMWYVQQQIFALKMTLCQLKQYLFLLYLTSCLLNSSISLVNSAY